MATRSVWARNLDMIDWRLVSVGCVMIIVVGFLVKGPTSKVVFFDVGQGDATLLQFGMDQILIDGGPDATVLRRLGEVMPWWDRRIEVVIATHPDQDHISGLVDVLDRYQVGLVLLPAMPHSSSLQSIWLTRIQNKVLAQGGSYRFANTGQVIESAGIHLTVLHPKYSPGTFLTGRNTNASSIVSRAEVCSRGHVNNRCLSVLLTGDADKVVEQSLVRSAIAQEIKEKVLDVDILKVGHHGSKSSTGQQIVDAASPAAVTISVGADNRYGHPSQEVLYRLAQYKLWRTDLDGSITFVGRNDQWFVIKQK